MHDANSSNGIDITLRGHAIADAGVGLEAIEQLLAQLTKDVMQEDVVLIDRLVIADSEVYGEAIRQELGTELNGQTHTENDYYIGTAKTIPLKNEGQRLTNTVVVRAGIVTAALGKDGVEPPVHPDLAKHILRHEVGHCIDHHLRLPCTPCGLTDQGEFSISRVGRYYQHVLLAEFAACFFSARNMPDELFQYLAADDAEPLSKAIDAALEAKWNYQTHSLDLHSLAFTASQAFWLVLVQFAKAMGHMLGSERKQAGLAMPKELMELPDANTFIQEVSVFLQNRVAEYPNWPPEGWPEMQEFWRRLCAGFGFYFEELEEGSSLWVPMGESMPLSITQPNDFGEVPLATRVPTPSPPPSPTCPSASPCD